MIYTLTSCVYELLPYAQALRKLPLTFVFATLNKMDVNGSSFMILTPFKNSTAFYHSRHRPPCKLSTRGCLIMQKKKWGTSVMSAVLCEKHSPFLKQAIGKDLKDSFFQHENKNLLHGYCRYQYR